MYHIAEMLRQANVTHHIGLVIKPKSRFTGVIYRSNHLCLWILEENVQSNLENQRVWQDLNILKDWKYMAEDVSHHWAFHPLRIRHCHSKVENDANSKIVSQHFPSKFGVNTFICDIKILKITF